MLSNDDAGPSGDDELSSDDSINLNDSRGTRRRKRKAKRKRDKAARARLEQVRSYQRMPKLPDFAGTKYIQYRINLVSLFKTFKLWTLISGEREMPDKVKDPQGYLEYMEDDQVAGDRIVRSLDLGLQLAVDVIPLAKDKFKHLEKQFAQKQDSEALDSWSKLTGLRFNPTRMTWNEFLLLYHKYIAEMAQHGMILDDSTRCMALQGAVKHVFNTRQIVLVIKKENLTEARLKDEIQAEHQRMKGNNPTWKRDPDEDELDEPVFLGMTYTGANDDPPGTKRKFNHEDTAYCTYHDKYGHWTRNCRSKNNDNHDGR